MTLEVVGGHVHIKASGLLSTRGNEVVYNLHLDSKHMLKHRSEEGQRHQPLLVRVQTDKLFHKALDNSERIKLFCVFEVRRWQAEDGGVENAVRVFELKQVVDHADHLVGYSFVQLTLLDQLRQIVQLNVAFSQRV